VPHAATEPPIITADYNSYEVTVFVTNAQTLDDVTTVKVVDNARPAIFSIYTLSFIRLPLIGDMQGMTQYQVYGLLYSDGHEIENPPYNAIDGDIDTRWANDNYGAWMALDLGSIVPIDAIALGVFNGDSRQNVFNIEISDDGVNWERILERAHSSGDTVEIEVIYLPQRVEARFIRYVGFGHLAGAWNSVIGFGALMRR